MKEFFIFLGIIFCMVAVGTMHMFYSAIVGGMGLFFLCLGVLKAPKQRKKFYCGTVDLFRSPELRYRIEKRR